MLGPVIYVVEFFGLPVDLKLVLTFPIAQPVKMHVHGFCAFWLDLTIDDALSHGVVSLDGCGWLFVPQIFEDDVEVYGFTCCDVTANRKLL